VSRDEEEPEVVVGGGRKMTSLAEELGLAGGSEAACDNARSLLLPSQDSAEVDSLPEDRGKPDV